MGTVCGAPGPLAAAALFVNDKYWENTPAKGKAHTEGNVESAVFTAILLLTSPPAVRGEMKIAYDAKAAEYTNKMETQKSVDDHIDQDGPTGQGSGLLLGKTHKTTGTEEPKSEKVNS